MKWLFHREGRRSAEPKDELDRLIKKIESFAPRAYRDQREMFYYNYRMMGLYTKPLTALLETLLQRERLEQDAGDFAADLFLRLKMFFDPRGKLSMPEAHGDLGLKRKYRELFVFFYDREPLALERKTRDGEET